MYGLWVFPAPLYGIFCVKNTRDYLVKTVLTLSGLRRNNF